MKDEYHETESWSTAYSDASAPPPIAISYNWQVFLGARRARIVGNQVLSALLSDSPFQLHVVHSC